MFGFKDEQGIRKAVTEAVERFGAARVNNAIRDRINENRARRTLQNRPAHTLKTELGGPREPAGAHT